MLWKTPKVSVNDDLCNFYKNLNYSNFNNTTVHNQYNDEISYILYTRLLDSKILKSWAETSIKSFW